MSQRKVNNAEVPENSFINGLSNLLAKLNKQLTSQNNISSIVCATHNVRAIDTMDIVFYLHILPVTVLRLENQQNNKSNPDL